MNIGADVLQLPKGLVLKTTVAPTENAASIEVARTFARIDSGIDDGFVQTLMSSATEKVEAFLNRKLITQTIVAHWEVGSDRIVLPFGNVQSVSTVEVGQSDGTFVTDTDYVLKENTVYPSADSTDTNIKITYVTGYGDNDISVPSIIKEMIYKLIVTSYDNRENVVVGESVNLMPNNWKTDLTPFINYESF